MPLISVVIPVFNGEKHIDRAINSVLNQTYKNFEIIVVDDGSKDETIGMVNKYKNPVIRLIMQTNQGVSVARNTGIRAAKGIFVAFLDADDEWKSDFLETIYSLINTYPNAGLYCTGYEIYSSYGIEQIKYGHSYIDQKHFIGLLDFTELCKLSLSEKMIITSSSVVIPKIVFDDIGYFPIGVYWAEDAYIWYQIAIKYKCIIDNKICSRIYNSQMSTTKKIKYVDEKQFPLVNDYKNIIKTYNLTGEQLFYYKELVYLQKIWLADFYLFIQNDKVRAAKSLKEAMKTKLNKKYWLKIFIKVKCSNIYYIYRYCKKWGFKTLQKKDIQSIES